MEFVLADTGVWYAMFDSRDPHYAEGKEKAERLSLFQIVLPWPTLYETLRTRFVRNGVNWPARTCRPAPFSQPNR